MRLFASGLLEEIWTPDGRPRTLRRLTNRRERLVPVHTRAKNEAHGVLACNLCESPGHGASRRNDGADWQRWSCLPTSASRSMAACAAVDCLNAEVAALDGEIVKQAFGRGRKCCG